MIHQTLQVALCSPKPHSDSMFSCSVAAFGQTADLILLDVQPEGDILHFYSISGLFSPQTIKKLHIFYKFMVN